MSTAEPSTLDNARYRGHDECVCQLENLGRFDRVVISPARAIFLTNFKVHHKTLIKMWITCLDPLLDPVSANSEKGRCSEWAVRVGPRLPSRFGQSGAARELGLVQIVVEASAIRGCFPNTQPTQPVFGWCCSQRFGGL